MSNGYEIIQNKIELNKKGFKSRINDTLLIQQAGLWLHSDFPATPPPVTKAVCSTRKNYYIMKCPLFKALYILKMLTLFLNVQLCLMIINLTLLLVSMISTYFKIFS